MFKYFFKREIKEKYIGNLTGFYWVIIQPLILLTIYWVVFDKIFGSRYPESEEIGFIVYLAIGFWPWLAFSESVIRSITVISEKKDLVGKVNIDFKIPVIATVSASFLLNMLGYIIVLVILTIFNENIKFLSLPLILIPLLMLYIFSIGLGLFLSSINVFVKDTNQFMTTLMTVWFFMTPIIYPLSVIPIEYKTYIQLNPLSIPISFIHNALITQNTLQWLNIGILYIIVIIFLYVSVKIFNKLSPSFDEFM